MTKTNFVNYAHRGASSYAPENTFAAFYKGIEMGANGIETDVQSTKDGVFVLHHDDTLERLCGINKKVSDFTLGELRELDFGVYFGEKYIGEKIVTLEDFLIYFSSKPITLAIEIKQDGIELDVYEMCKQFLKREQYYITSFSLDAILNLAELEEPPRLGFLAGGFSDIITDVLYNADVEQYCPYGPELSKEQMKYLRNVGFSNIRAWGISDTEIMKEVYYLGVDGMTVNFPDKLKELILL